MALVGNHGHARINGVTAKIHGPFRPGSECIVQAPFAHIGAMTQEKYLLEKVNHQIFFPKQFYIFCLVVPLPLLRVQGL